MKTALLFMLVFFLSNSVSAKGYCDGKWSTYNSVCPTPTKPDDLHLGISALHNNKPEIALVHLKRAALNGDSVAQVRIGLMYQNGLVVEKSRIKAHMWYNIAVEEGLSYRRDIARNMNVEEILTAQKLAKECISSNYSNCF
jgi:TPR repeat protein